MTIEYTCPICRAKLFLRRFILSTKFYLWDQNRNDELREETIAISDKRELLAFYSFYPLGTWIRKRSWVLDEPGVTILG